MQKKFSAIVRSTAAAPGAVPGANCCARCLLPRSLCRSVASTIDRRGPGHEAEREAATGPPPLPPPAVFSPEDDQFLNELEQASFLFFWEQTNPQTGLVKDRSNVRINDTGLVGSIASTGFALTAICIAEQRGFVSHEDATKRVLATLTFLWRTLPTHRGFFYHFANINTGERLWDSEVSSVDTAILLCGILTCRAHFEDREIVQLAHDDIQPRRLDLAFRRHSLAHPGMDAGVRISAVQAGTTTAN